MPEEFQPYFYLTQSDFKAPQPGRVIGILLIFASFILLLMKVFFGWRFSWGVILIVFGIGIASIYLGKVIQKQKEKPKIEKPVLVHSD